jgi:uncharacterized tellurite resistance protein B-like protein
MLIIGTMDWTSNIGAPSAYCPNCGLKQIFRQKSSRPFLTLYFIPCIPLGRTLEYLQCTVCKGTFGLELLQISPHINDHLQSIVPFEEDLLRAMATIMLEDGGIEEVEIEAAQFAFQRLTGQELSRDELGEVCDIVARMKQTTVNFLRQSEDRWDDEHRVKLAQAMFWTASATGTISKERTTALMALGRILNISEDRYKEIIAMTLDWHRSR